MYTSNFARLRRIQAPLRPVSIARGTPRWFRGLRYEALAPEWEWLRASREEYDRAFRRRLNQLDPVRVYMERSCCAGANTTQGVTGGWWPSGWRKVSAP